MKLHKFINEKFDNDKFQKITVATFLIWLGVFVFIPNALVLVVSFLTKDSTNFYALPFTLDNYLSIFNPLYGKVILSSLYMASIATIICLILGYPFAFLLTKFSPKIRSLMLFLVVLPFWTNSLIRIYGMKIFLGLKGIMNQSLLALGLIHEPIRVLNTQGAVIIGLVYLLLPFMVMPLYNSLEKLDKSLLEASRDLGANGFQRFIKIIIPLTMPGIVTGCLLVLLPAMGMFYVADVIGGSQILLVGNIIKSEFLVSRNWPLGSAISIGLTLLMALLILGYWKSSKLLNKKMELE